MRTIRTTKLTAFLFLLIFSTVARAQECVTCNKHPSVAQYDLDIQVPKPADTGLLLMQWQYLYTYSGKINAIVFSENGKNLSGSSCVKFTINAGDDDQLKAGPYATNLPSSDIHPGYLTTGFIKPDGDHYLLQVELQTACARKTVAVSKIPFQLSTDLGYIRSIAQQAASGLSPVSQKINAFEEREKAANKNVVIGGSLAGGELTVKLKNNRLKPGESTEFDLELKDCDGSPLKDKKIFFTKSDLNGLPLTGTKGGVVTPVTVITDAQGRAKAKFTMAANAKYAVVNANCLVTNANGCGDAFTGSAGIGGGLKVTINYEAYQSRDMKLEALKSAYNSSLAEEHSGFIRNHRTVLYYFPAAPPKQGVQILVSKEDNNGSKTVYEVERGFFNSWKKGHSNAGAFGLEVENTDSIEQNGGNASPASPAEIYVSINQPNEVSSFTIAFLYPDEQKDKAIEGPAAFSITVDDKEARFTSKKINDPASPYKTEYTIHCKRDLKTDFGAGLVTGWEEVTVHILSPY